MKSIIDKIRCLLGDHDWTCAANEGIKPKVEQVKAGIVGFYDYAQGYCKRCKKLLPL